MPGYNVEGPGAAFSNTIEGYLQNQFKNRILEEESRQRAQDMAMRAQQHQQTIALQQAQLAQRIKEGEYEDFARKTSTFLPNDVLPPEYIAQARRLGFGNLAPEAKPLPEAMPGVAALPLEGGSPETSQPAGVNPPQAVRFPGTAGQRQDIQDVETAMRMAQTMPAGSPERRALEFTAATGFRRSAPSFSSGLGSDLNRHILRVNQERAAQGLQPLTADEELQETRKLADARRAGGQATYEPDTIDMSAWLHLARGDMPSARTEGGPGNQDAVADRMSRLQKDYHLPPLAANAASYKAWSTALNDQTKRASAMQAVANGADKNLDLVLEASPSVVRTDSKWVNEQVNKFVSGLTPATELTDLEIKIYSAAREYAKVVTGSSASVAELSAAATEQANKLLNAAQSHEALVAAVGAMKADMKSYTTGQVNQVNYLRDLIGNMSGPPGAYEPQPGLPMPGEKPATPEKPKSGLDSPATGLPAGWWQANGGR